MSDRRRRYNRLEEGLKRWEVEKEVLLVKKEEESKISEQ